MQAKRDSKVRGANPTFHGSQNDIRLNMASGCSAPFKLVVLIDNTP